MILKAATEGWNDVKALLESLPYEAKREVVSEGLAWALCNAADEESLDDEESMERDNELFEELGRIGIVLSLRRAGLLLE